MTENAIKQSGPQGVSLIILTQNGADHLDRFFSTFFACNTYRPLEIIVVDHASTDNTAEIIEKYQAKGFILGIYRDANYTYAESNNMAAQEAVYPNLVFVNNDIIYTADLIARAVSRLIDPLVGAVGVRLDDYANGLPEGEEPGVQHSGVNFLWDEKKEFYRPTQIRHATVTEAESSGLASGFYQAVTAAFLICSKEDFTRVGGFCEEYDYGFEDIDFCLKLAIELDKRCYCINDLALQHVEGATRKSVEKEVARKRKANNDGVFIRRMGQLVKKMVEEERTAVSAASIEDYQNVRADYSKYQKYIYHEMVN